MNTEAPRDINKVFMALYEPVHLRLSRYCQTQASSTEDAKDLMSETVLTAYERFGTLRNHEAFLYFLFSIARNLMLQKYRKEKLFLLFKGSRNPAAYFTEQEGPANIDNLILQNALQKLPIQQREAIVLFEITGFSLQDISVLQDTSLSNVKQRVSRARARLKELLKDSESIDYNRGPVPTL